MLVGLIFFGPASPSPAELERFTKAGLALYQPEHDLPLYVAGCALTVLFTLFFVWRWHRQEPAARARHRLPANCSSPSSARSFFDRTAASRELPPN